MGDRRDGGERYFAAAVPSIELRSCARVAMVQWKPLDLQEWNECVSKGVLAAAQILKVIVGYEKKPVRSFPFFS